MITRPLTTEFAEPYQRYIDRVPDGNIIEILQSNLETWKSLIENLSEEKLNYRYAEGKWSIKEIIVHILDGERIFSYRALRFARNDKTSLQGFDENAYTPESNASNRTKQSLLDELTAIRRSTIEMFKNFTPEMFMRTGVASGYSISVRALAYVIAGHELHHMNVIKERYLK